MWSTLSLLCLLTGLTLVNGQVPVQLNTNPGQRDASINWQNNGICSNSISGYEVEYNSSGVTQTATEQPASPSVGTGSITLLNLTPCTDYSVRVRANCTDGTMSNFSDFVDFTTTIDVPSAPVNLTSTSQTQTMINLAWTTPQECGDTVMMYTATYNGMSTSTMMSETTLQITGLTFFTNYTINVTATNSEGTGAASNTIVVQTAEATPTAPLNLTGVALNTTVIRLVWEPPQTPNGIVIRYTVHYNNGTSANANSMSVTAPAMTTDIDGLTPDTNYTFALTATNGAAESVNSSEVTIATPAIEPFAPSMPRNLRGGSIGPTWVKLAWDPPLRSASLANYIVAFESPPGLNSTITTNETCVNITGLQPETTYTCSCTPVTSNGTQGEPSFVTGTTSTAGLSMPMNVVATATSTTTIRVQWMHPDFARTIDHYFVSWQPSVPSGVTLAGGMMEINCTSANTPVMGTTNCTDVMEFNITGLEEYVSYTVMVIASNDVGNSTSGTATARTLPAIPDGVVSMINATPTYNSVILQWDAIPYLMRNGPNVTYIVTITQTGTSDVIALLTVATLSVTRTGLTPLTMYDVTVRAANDEGNAAVVSLVQQFTTLEQPPAAVSGITVASDDSGTTANISWTPPSGNITMYSIRITDSSGNVIVTGSAMNSSFMANELSPFILYTVTVTPSTSGGAGSSASHMFYTRQDVPTVMVMNVRASVGGSGLTVTFDPITNPNEARGNVSYMVCYSLRGNTTQVCQTTSDSSITFPGTFSNIFAVTVTPVTAAGPGMASTAIEVDGRPNTLPIQSIALIVTLCVVTPIVALVVIVALILLCVFKSGS